MSKITTNIVHPELTAIFSDIIIPELCDKIDNTQKVHVDITMHGNQLLLETFCEHYTKADDYFVSQMYEVIDALSSQKINTVNGNSEHSEFEWEDVRAGQIRSTITFSISTDDFSGVFDAVVMMKLTGDYYNCLYYSWCANY